MIGAKRGKKLGLSNKRSEASPIHHAWRVEYYFAPTVKSSGTIFIETDKIFALL